MTAAAVAVSSTRENAPNDAVVATPKNDAKPALGGGAVEHVARQRHYRWQRAQIGREFVIGIKRIRHDDLARLDAGDFGGERRAVALADAEFAGRDIDPGQREAVLVGGRAGARQRQEVIVAAGVEQQILRQRAGRHQPHHVAAYDALGAALARLGRILELLTHGDAMAERDQAMQIFVGALDRDAAHRNVAAEMLAALGQHDAERARSDLGVTEEQLVEIAHPVEQEAIRIGGLDLDILLHHRRDAADVVGCFGSGAPGLRQRFGIVNLDGAGGVHGANASRGGREEKA